jgi:hypothetical protein
LDIKDIEFSCDAHVHGPIRLCKDIQTIYAPRKEIEANELAVHIFTSQFNVPILPIERVSIRK